MRMMKGLISSVLTLVVLFSAYGQEEEEAVEIHEINWLSFEEAYRLNKITPKRWMIDISTSWCGYCKKMDKDTFSDSLIVDLVNANYYAVALDGEYRDDIVLDGKTFQFVKSGRRGYHQLPAELMGGKMSYPTIVFMNNDLSILSPIPGYHGPKDFIEFLEFFKVYHPVDNPIKWDNFKANFNSPYPSVE